MLLDAIAAPLALLAVALPFLFAFTEPPVANFWPLLMAWGCGAVLLLVAARAAWAGAPPARQVRWWGGVLAGGLAVAAVVASFIGLVQYVAGDVGLGPWIHSSVPGQAVGNLRQRNQQGTLLSLGAWAWLWWSLHASVKQPGGNLLQGAEAADGARWQGRRGPSGAWGVFATVALVCIAVGGAATASRTVVVQWLLILGLLVGWRGAGRAGALRLGVAGFGIFLAAAWALPEALWTFQGVRADALFHRFADASSSCTSRRVLWSNVLTLIGQKPWLGWGWGELDYAHYVTLFPGERFCVLLDNAHNLPLHLAVELGVPAALALCGVAAAACWSARPWRETAPARQLAWGVLAIIGLHSMLEYPLWYGPFQWVALVSIAILLWPRRVRPPGRSDAPAGSACLGAAALILGVCGVAAWDYHRVSQLYKPAAQRSAAYRDDTQAKVADSLFFSSQLDFARLTTAGLTPANAARLNAMAHALLHYSPEPRVLQVLIESAVMLGRDEEAAFHMQRYRVAYPAEYTRWMGARSARAASAAP
jgi:O-antigen polymerase